MAIADDRATNRWQTIASIGAIAIVLVGSIVTLYTRLAETEGKLIDLQNQLCSQDTVRNVMHAEDMRNLAMVWQKLFGAEYPIGNAYYPTVGQCGGSAK